jgi:hypothetical protein
MSMYAAIWHSSNRQALSPNTGVGLTTKHLGTDTDPERRAAPESPREAVHPEELGGALVLNLLFFR